MGQDAQSQVWLVLWYILEWPPLCQTLPHLVEWSEVQTNNVVHMQAAQLAQYPNKVWLCTYHIVLAGNHCLHYITVILCAGKKLEEMVVLQEKIFFSWSVFIYSFFWAIISTRFISNEVGVLVLHSGLTKLNQTTNWRVCISISVGPSSWGLRSMSKISTPKSWRYQGLEGLRWCQAMEFLEVSCYLQPFFQCWFCNLVFHVIEAWKFNLQLWVIWCSELQT